ncbi:hypothetical protein CEXT_252551 [Caerostris extrusa]|uniref:Uncharacterized protein n=1 Tax=Caerostris extrusa TaxID=172846 RepID=A0AAV4MZM3_CAEEX|nr:hypothetical protein CEXT_252551 [Caerostris extrusa]
MTSLTRVDNLLVSSARAVSLMIGTDSSEVLLLGFLTGSLVLFYFIFKDFFGRRTKCNSKMVAKILWLDISAYKVNGKLHPEKSPERHQHPPYHPNPKEIQSLATMTPKRVKEISTARP